MHEKCGNPVKSVTTTEKYCLYAYSKEANNAIKAKRKIFSLVSDGDVEESTSLFNAELKFFVSNF